MAKISSAELAYRAVDVASKLDYVVHDEPVIKAASQARQDVSTAARSVMNLVGEASSSYRRAPGVGDRLASW